MKGDVEMDKQTQFTKTQIPINTRTIGTPEGIYILYLEDYVHTFMKKLLSLREMRDVALMAKEEFQIENSMQPDIILFGKIIEENGKYNLVVSGGAATEGENVQIQLLNDKYFPSCTYIGKAYISLNKDLGLRLELILSSTRVILDDFYVYYDQNEEMQNYLIEWNTDKENGKSIDDNIKQDSIVRDNWGSSKPRAENSPQKRGIADDAVRLGRIAQAYNKEEVKVSFMWNIMNVLCLSFVVCVMVYGIISINNFSKMKNMQTSIDYCMAILAENFILDTNKNDGQAVTTMQQIGDTINQDVQKAENSDENQTKSVLAQNSTNIDDKSAEPSTIQDVEQNEAQNNAITENIAQNNTITENTAQNNAITENIAQNNTIAENIGNTAQNSAISENTAQNSEASGKMTQNNDMTENIEDMTQNSVISENTVQNSEPSGNMAQNNAISENTAQNSEASESVQSATQQNQQNEPEQSTENKPQYYVVREGDTLRTICYEIYGDYTHVEEICKWNNIQDPDNILYGQKLLLP